MTLARYHVMIDRIRTTVRPAPAQPEMLALKLGVEPQTPAAHALPHWENCPALMERAHAI